MKEEIATHSSILAGEIHGQRSLVGYSPWVYKELDTTGNEQQQQQHVLDTSETWSYPSSYDICHPSM